MTVVARVSPAEIDRVKEQSDLVAAVRSKVVLVRLGREWKGKCPFHAETTPSFYVVPDKRMFHCFGCGATGDIFKWLELSEHLGFAAAYEKLKQNHAETADRFISHDTADERIRLDADAVRKRLARAHDLWAQGVSPYGTAV